MASDLRNLLRHQAAPDTLDAALHAAAILGLSDKGLKRRLDAWRAKQTKSVAKTPK